MMTEGSILQSCQALGAFRAGFLSKLWDWRYTYPKMHVDLERTIEDFREGCMLLTDSFGLAIKHGQLIPALQEIDELSNFVLANMLQKDTIRDLIEQDYGKQAAFAFSMSQLIGITSILSSAFSVKGPIPARRRSIMADQRLKAIEFCSSFGKSLKKWRQGIQKQFGTRFSARCSNLSRVISSGRWTPAHFGRIAHVSGELLNESVPHFDTINSTLERAKKVVGDLNVCRPGKTAWRYYEDICTRALRMLFVPPFRKVVLQSRNEHGHERRDAILPNNQFSGFWSMLRQEFESRHLVCEFKNNAKPLGKSDLNQLRIYLSRPTIGRFGLLFHRGRLGSGAIRARREAYEQSKILVLFIDDNALEKLLRARAFVGSATHVLDDMKTQFEIAY
jgi:hypothetical protein